ncbi:MAG: hypothetical protein U9R08_04265 [Nanoarchaeota archaeon]|nr:hypothetical protein [Nanoarchaeota archaeon]
MDENNKPVHSISLYKIALIIIFIIFILLAIYIFLPKEVVESGIESELEVTTSPEFVDSLAQDIKKLDAELNVCKSDDFMNRCNVFKNKDVSMCNSINNPARALGCKVDYFITIGAMNNNLEECDFIADVEFGTYCRALISENLELCNDLQDQSNKDICISIISLMSNLEAEHTDYSINYYYYLKALKRKSVIECDMIRGFNSDDFELINQCKLILGQSVECTSKIKESCEDAYYYKLALLKSNVDDCDSIIDSNLKEDCKLDVEAGITFI